MVIATIIEQALQSGQVPREGVAQQVTRPQLAHGAMTQAHLLQCIQQGRSACRCMMYLAIINLLDDQTHKQNQGMVSDSNASMCFCLQSMRMVHCQG